MHKRAIIFGIITLIGWSSGFAGTVASLQGGFSANSLILFRLLVASFLFMVLAFFIRKRLTIPNFRDLIRISLVAIIGITFYYVGITYGMQYIQAGTASMIVGSGPIFATLIAIIFLKERLKWYGWAGLFTGFFGIILITVGAGELAFQFTRGILPVFFATIATAVFYAFQKPLLEKFQPIELTAYFTWVATVPLLIFTPELWANLQTTTLEANIAGIYIGIVPSALCYVTWAIATSYGDVSKISTLLYLEPAFAIIIAWIWLNELPTGLSMLGGLIVIVSVATVNWVELRKLERRKAT